jgi:rhodanese-related sulfurtransferase
MHHKIFIFLFVVLAVIGCKSTSHDMPQTDQNASIVNFAKDISIAEANALIAVNEVVVVDVRTPEEIADGKLDGALEIDFNGDNFLAEFQKLDKDKTYLLYCRSGNRSGQAMDLLAKNGYNKLYNMLGGYTKWAPDTN